LQIFDIFPGYAVAFVADVPSRFGSMSAGTLVSAETQKIWQQIGNTVAHATAMRTQCELVQHYRKQLRISGFPTSTQRHAAATLNVGNQVRILDPQFVTLWHLLAAIMFSAPAVGGTRLADGSRYRWPVSVFLLQLRL